VIPATPAEVRREPLFAANPPFDRPALEIEQARAEIERARVEIERARADAVSEVNRVFAPLVSDTVPEKTGEEADVSNAMPKDAVAALATEAAQDAGSAAEDVELAKSQAAAPVAETDGEDEESAELQAAAPAWVDSKPHREGADYLMPISVGPYTSEEEIHAQLPASMRAAVALYTVDLIGPQARARVQLPADYIEKNIKSDEWWTTRELTVDDKRVHMPWLHVLLKFDREDNAVLHEAWRRVQVQERVAASGVLGGGLLLLLGAVYGGLRYSLRGTRRPAVDAPPTAAKTHEPADLREAAAPSSPARRNSWWWNRKRRAARARDPFCRLRKLRHRAAARRRRWM
jgi:hypothetical protein